VKSLSVLYVHHSGVFGGASRSLLEMVRAFPKGAVKPYLITQHGKVPAIFRQYEFEVMETIGLSQFDHTRFGYYRGVRWLLLLRELAWLPFTVLAMLKARKQWPEIDLIHINEVTNVPSILLAGWLFRVPVIVHVRSVQQTQYGKLRRKWIIWLLKRSDVRIAIDSTVRNSLPQELAVDVVHNGFSCEGCRTEVKSYADNVFSTRPMYVCFVGGLLVMKGILEFVQAARLCREAGLNVKFIVVGETPRQHRSMRAALLQHFGFSFDVPGWCTDFIERHGLEDIIEFRGFMLEIDAVYRQADVLCFPSHLNAVGRPVIEAALAGVPSIVAMSQLSDDTIRHQETGLMIREKDAGALFDAIAWFYRHPTEISRMGRAALTLAEQNFDIGKNAERVLKIYRDLLNQSDSA